MPELDSGIEANGILEVMPDGFGFIRCENFLPGENDVYKHPPVQHEDRRHHKRQPKD